MSKTIEETAACGEQAVGVSRRGFLTGGGILAGAAVMGGIMPKVILEG